MFDASRLALGALGTTVSCTDSVVGVRLLVVFEHLVTLETVWCGVESMQYLPLYRNDRRVIGGRRIPRRAVTRHTVQEG